jgi:hypothetical protein
MPDPQHIDADDDPRLAALMAWRQQLIDSGAVSRNAFKEAHLRLVLRSGRTDVAQIRAMLPGCWPSWRPTAAVPGNRAARLAGTGRGTRKRSTLVPTRRGCSGQLARTKPRRETPPKSTTSPAISLRLPSVSSAARSTRLA